MSLSDRELQIRQRLKDDFSHYAARCLRIRTKGGEIHPLRLNAAQLHLHQKLEEQRRKTGKVRALVLKGRQQGISTYIGGRFYQKVTHSKGKRVFILTHEQDATNNLFGMVERYHEHCPDLVRPSTGVANAKELYFDKLESGYAVGTAGAKAVGRSQTIQLFHGSEVAFWPNAETHFAGVVQAIPDLDGTEILLESTANGVGGEYHERWQQAEIGIGDYIAVFIPWFWQEEYRRPVPEGFSLNEESEHYRDTHGLTNEHMVWRQAKIAELKDPLLFKQEYPATADEAFQLTGHDSFIKPELILDARRSKNIEAVGAKIMGVDPSRFGDDLFSIAFRQGRVVPNLERESKLSNVEGASFVKRHIDQYGPDAVFIDVGGQGAGVYDILMSWGKPYSEIVRPVNFGGKPQDDYIVLEDGSKRPGPRNKRAEIWMRSRDWLGTEGGVSIPDEDRIQAEACGPSYHYDANQFLVLESKEQMRRRGVRSPDDWDAIALTFAEPVAMRNKVKTTRNYAPSGGWMG